MNKSADVCLLRRLVHLIGSVVWTHLAETSLLAVTVINGSLIRSPGITTLPASVTRTALLTDEAEAEAVAVTEAEAEIEAVPVTAIVNVIVTGTGVQTLFLQGESLEAVVDRHVRVIIATVAPHRYALHAHLKE